MTALQNLNQTIDQLEALAQQSPEKAVAQSGSLFNKFVRNNNDQTIFKLASGLLQHKKLFAANQLGQAIRQKNPKDARAHHYLATIATRAGFHEVAVDHLINCLDLKPQLPAVRFELANALYMSGNYPLALKQVELVPADAVKESGYYGLQAACLSKLGRFEDAAAVYKTLMDNNPGNAPAWLRYGVALKTIGQSQPAIDAFRQALTINPSLGEAYWNLANLKTYQFSQADIDAMRALLETGKLGTADQVFLCFSLGNAMESQQDYAAAFAYFERANQWVSESSRYDATKNTQMVNKAKQVYTPAHFSKPLSRCTSAAPIFVVGLPRSGSTLIEQILSCHSQIDATMELTEIASMARSLNLVQKDGRTSGYPQVVTDLHADELTRFGEEYLKRTQAYRGRAAHFIDKTPANFLHIGLIKSILPNAKVIDTRRNPMACGLSIYKQLFASGFAFANSQSDIAAYYKDYLHLMDHWHAVLPGQLLTVQYEDVIDQFEATVRRVLDYCELEFDPACLEFHKSKRAVATVSSEQVRQPLYSAAVHQWKHYEPYLNTLKQALAIDTNL